MNRIPTSAAPAQTAQQSQSAPGSLPNFLHVSHSGPVALEAYLHLYVDGIARAERELAGGRR